MAHEPHLPTYECILCHRMLPCGAGQYPIRPVRGWGKVMLCNDCRQMNRDGIVPGRPYSAALEAHLRKLGVKPIFNEDGYIVIPD